MNSELWQTIVWLTVHLLDSLLWAVFLHSVSIPHLQFPSIGSGWQWGCLGFLVYNISCVPIPTSTLASDHLNTIPYFLHHFLHSLLILFHSVLMLSVPSTYLFHFLFNCLKPFQDIIFFCIVDQGERVKQCDNLSIICKSIQVVKMASAWKFSCSHRKSKAADGHSTPDMQAHYHW